MSYCGKIARKFEGTNNKDDILRKPAVHSILLQFRINCRVIVHSQLGENAKIGQKINKKNSLLKIFIINLSWNTLDYLNIHPRLPSAVQCQHCLGGGRHVRAMCNVVESLRWLETIGWQC